MIHRSPDTFKRYPSTWGDSPRCPPWWAWLTWSPPNRAVSPFHLGNIPCGMFFTDTNGATNGARPTGHSVGVGGFDQTTKSPCESTSVNWPRKTSQFFGVQNPELSMGFFVHFSTCMLVLTFLPIMSLLVTSITWENTCVVILPVKSRC